MNVAIVGSRDYPDRAQVESYVATLPLDTVVISGGARGVDTWAVDAACIRGLATRVFHADWSRWGRSAGVMRNKTIVESCDRLVAFHYRASRGTAHAIAYARSIGIGKPVTIMVPDGD